MHDVDVTYGSFLQYNKGKINNVSWIPRDYDQNIIENKEYRNDIWRAMHLRVMKGQHLKHISALDFIDDEYKFIQSSTDMVESYASLELCQGRHKKINEHLMIYNRENSMYYPTSYYNKTDKIKKEQIIKNVKNISPYQEKVKYDKIAIIDIDKDNYKDMIQFYKKYLIRKMDLFLVRGSIIQYYINKLNAYQNIVYLTHDEYNETDYKIEEMEKNKVPENIEIQHQETEQENVIKEIVTDKIDEIVDSLQDTEGNISKSNSKIFDIHSNFSSSQSFINNEFIEDDYENQSTDKDYLPQSYN